MTPSDPTKLFVFADYPQSSCSAPAIRTVAERAATAACHRDSLDADTERELLAILRAPSIGTTRRTFQDKEYALGAAFSSLTPLQARRLHRRLANPSGDDALAAEFARLVVDRRHRLLEFLADARRRAAIAAARQP